MQDEASTSQDNDRQMSHTSAPASPGQHNPLPAPVKSGKANKLVVIAAVAAVMALVAGGLFGYRQYQTNSASQTNNTAAGQIKEESGADAANLDEVALAEEPATSVTDEAPINTASGGGSNGNASSGTSAPQPRTVDFTKGGGNIDDGVLTVSSNLSASETGTCAFKFSLNGSVRVYRTAQITNSKVCKVEIPVSEFPKSAIYNFELTFKSTDGLAAADLAYDVEVH